MRFSTNSAKDILKVFRSSLKGKYDSREIDNFFFLAMEKYADKSKTQILSNTDLKVSESVINHIVEVIEQLEKFVPIQYILGEVVFYELKLSIDKRTLIPRPETEELVSMLINDFRNSDHKITVVDAGTGSGCIAIAVKKYLPEAEVIALDFSEDALNLAKENAKLNDVEIRFERIDMREINEMNALPSIDVIISNPPYVRESEKKQMQLNVLDYEPYVALFVSDEDPLIYYRHLLQFSEIKLKKGGRLYFEINELLGNELLTQVLNYNLNASIVNDFHGRPRFCIIKKPE